MKVLLINKFLYPKGGAEISTLNTGKLLTAKGHKVLFWGMKHFKNPDYPHKELFVSHVDFNRSMGNFRKLKTSINFIYSFEAKNKVEKLIEREKPDIVHLNNFAHHISPSILDVFENHEVPTVMSLRDYKLVCPSYSMLSDGKPCERCKNGKYYWCFLNKCTKESYSKSLLNVIEMYLHHKILHIYDLVGVFISPSMFLKEKLKKMGFQKQIVYIPNFIDEKDYLPGYNSNGKTICYFGRLSREKGLFTLVDGMKGLGARLKIIGDGPLRKDLEERVKNENINNITFLGYKSGDELKEEVRNSIVVILPSECYENNPRTVLEAFALGKPVIGSRIGGIPELVRDGETGLTFEAGNIEDLRGKIECLINSPSRITEMGKNARRFVEENFNPEKHYQKLMKIYRTALKKRF